MGNPLGFLMANIFVGLQEEQMFDVVTKPYCYACYVNDSFVSFENRY